MTNSQIDAYIQFSRQVCCETFLSLDEKQISSICDSGNLIRLDPGDRLHLTEGGDPVLTVRGCLGRGMVSEEDRIYLPQPLPRGIVIGEEYLLTETPVLPTKTEERRVHALVPSLVMQFPASLYDFWRNDVEFLRDGLRRSVDLEMWTRRYLIYHAIIEKEVVLARCVCLLGDLLGRPVMESLELTIRQDDLARHACLTRRHVNSLLGQWSEQGIVETAKGRLIIVDAIRLLAVAKIRDIQNLRGDPDGTRRLEEG